MSFQKPRIFHVVLCIFIFVLDRASKIWALHSLQGEASQEVFCLSGIEGFFTFATNSGAAWGVMSSYPLLLLGIRGVFVLLLSYLAFFTRLSHMAAFGVFLILSGAISNIVDSFMYGEVIDMLHVRFWGYDYPIFNIADTAITCGALLFLFSSWSLHNDSSSSE